MKKILISGANPAWQKALTFPVIKPGKVNRAGSALAFASGKGINFARAVSIYGKAAPEVVQFTAGSNGRRVSIELDNEKIAHTDIILADGETRVCSTCIDLENQQITELIEPSPVLSNEDIVNFKNTIISKIPSVDAFAICGTMPAGAPMDIYAELTDAALKADKYVLADMIFNLTPVLESSNGKVILKINADELAEYSGIADTVEALKMLDAKYHLACAAITDGAGKTYLLDRHEIYEYTLPALAEIVNAIGCGDTASAVMLSEYLYSGNAVESCRMASACASANCLSMKCAEFKLDFAGDYAKNITIRKI